MKISSVNHHHWLTWQKRANGIAKGHISGAKRPYFASRDAIFHNILKSCILHRQNLTSMAFRLYAIFTRLSIGLFITIATL